MDIQPKVRELQNSITQKAKKKHKSLTRRKSSQIHLGRDTSSETRYALLFLDWYTNSFDQQVIFKLQQQLQKKYKANGTPF